MRHDLVVIGAGPAGMVAAVEAASYGLSVALLDEQQECGGQIYRSVASVAKTRPDEFKRLGTDYARGLDLSIACQQANIDHRSGATVWNIEAPAGRVYYSASGSSYHLSARRILIATGAMERPLPIRGWTLSGVMAAGAAQVLLKSAGLVPDGPVVLAGCGPLLLLAAGQLNDAGVEIGAVVETTTWRDYLAGSTGLLQALAAPEYLLKGTRMLRTLRRARIPMFASARHFEAVGSDVLEAVQFHSRGQDHTIPATSLLLHDGVIPNTALSRLAGIEHEWCALQKYWRPRTGPVGNTSEPNVLVAGDGAGILGARAAEHSGHIVGMSVARDFGAITDSEYRRHARRHQLSRWRHKRARPLLDSLFAPIPTDVSGQNDDVIVCRCYDVSREAIEEAIAEGCVSPDQVKAAVRSGMGPCQGRMCGPTVANIIAETLDEDLERVGLFRARPPAKPITLRELASLEPARANVDGA